MRFVLAAAAVVAALTAAVIPAKAHVAAPGPQCGGTLWKLMTLSDTGNKSVAWAPALTTLGDVAKLAAPAKVPATRSTIFTKKTWQISNVILVQYRMASNGEIVFQLFDGGSSTYMNAYMPSAQCLPAKARGRAQVLAARNGFLKDCPAPSAQWQN